MDQDVEFYRALVDNMTDGVYFVDRTRTITYWSKGAERLTGYSAAEVMGRRCRDAILNHVDDGGRELCGSRCPLKATIADGQVREAHVWLHHADGHRHPVWVRAAPIRDGNGKITGAVELFSDNTAVVDARTRMTEMEQLALVDPLTGLGNRRYLLTQLTTRFDEFVRYHRPFGILFADIDHFKRINDEYGHDVGDDSLKVVARTLSYALRNDEAITRFGGEEFVAVLPLIDLDTLTTTAERLRTLVESSRLVVNRQAVKLTVSIGGTMAVPGDDADTLLRRADSLLYAAKEAGRNRITIDAPPDGATPEPATAPTGNPTDEPAPEPSNRTPARPVRRTSR